VAAGSHDQLVAYQELAAHKENARSSPRCRSYRESGQSTEPVEINVRICHFTSPLNTTPVCTTVANDGKNFPQGFVYSSSRCIMKHIVDTAGAAGTFKTLVTALSAVGFIDTLRGAGPVTMLAPTDEAFATIPTADLMALLADE